MQVHKKRRRRRRRREEDDEEEDGRWYFQVYRQAMEGDLLAVKPAALWCTRQSCSMVVKPRITCACRGLFNRGCAEERRRQPSHSRAGLTSIGLEIERTPLSNQTSPRRAPSHSSDIKRENMYNSKGLKYHLRSPDFKRLLLLYSVRELRPTVRPQPRLRPTD